MKDRSDKPYTSKTLLNAWRQVLENLNAIKADPSCDLDPASVAEVTDYLLDRIDAYRPAVALENAAKNAPKNARFASIDNRPDNRGSTGTDNAR